MWIFRNLILIKSLKKIVGKYWIDH